MMRRTDTRTDTDRQPYSVKQAAAATGRTKPTILRAIQANRIVARKDVHGRWQIEPAELHRVYRPVVTERSDTCTDAKDVPAAPYIELLRSILTELQKLTAILGGQQIQAVPAPEGSATPTEVTVPVFKNGETLKSEETHEALSAPAKDKRSAELARSAQQALNSGRLAEADALLEQAKDAEFPALRQARELEQQAREAIERCALNAAKSLADRGKIAVTQRRYADAAECFKEAVALVPAGHPAQSADYLHRQAVALYRDGDERDDHAALNRSIETWRLALQYRPRDTAPLDWAATQNNLGLVLADLGNREDGTAHLTEAVAAFRAALEEQPRDRVPLDWARTQHNLGLALTDLGRRESGTAHLTEAVAAFRAALAERPRDRVPLDWARTQDNLGLALTELGKREGGTAHLTEAIVAFRAALEEWPRDRVPLDWATSLGDQGVALMMLAARLGDANRVRMAGGQIATAFVTLRDGGDADAAAYYKAQLQYAQILLDRLTKR